MCIFERVGRCQQCCTIFAMQSEWQLRTGNIIRNVQNRQPTVAMNQDDTSSAHVDIQLPIIVATYVSCIVKQKRSICGQLTNGQRNAETRTTTTNKTRTRVHPSTQEHRTARS